MKIVILGENVSVHIQKWINAISQEKSIDLHVITFDRGVKYENVTYHYINLLTNSKLDYFLNIPKVKRLVKSIKPDLLHAHYATSYGFMGALVNFHPFIITGWGADIFDSPKNPIMKWLLQFSFKKADYITVLTEVTRKEIKHLTNKSVTLIPFGVDLQKFRFVPRQEKNTVHIGTIRTLSEKYGVEYLIRAFALLRKKHNNIELDIVGDGPLRVSLENLAEELGIKDHVVFHGFVNQNDDFKKYFSLLSSMDIFTILSVLDSETFGVAAVEAFACGIPIVATNVGGLPEVIDNELTGILVPPRNFEATAEALERLIIDLKLRIEFGNNGRKKVEQLYDWKNNTNLMISLYKNAILNK